MSRALETRLSKLEASEMPPRLEVVRKYEGQTRAEAWAAERGTEPMPSGSGDLVVFIHHFCPR